MATADDYAKWIVDNQDKKGTPEFDTVAQAYQLAKAESKPKIKVEGFGTKPEDFDPTSGMSGGQKFLAGAGKAFSDMGRGVKQLTGFGDQGEIDAAKKRDAALMKTGAGMAGNVLGNVAMMLPTAAIPGVNTYTGAGLLGAGLGALQPVASDDSRMGNIGLGAAGGMAGQGIANAVGRAFKPVQSELPDTLKGLAGRAEEMGIPLNPAQKTGSKPLQTINAVLDNLPFTAGRQEADKQAQRAAFNRAVLGAAGENADTATPEVLSAARGRIGGVFRDVSERNTINLGNDYLEALAKVDAQNRALKKFASPEVSRTVEAALDLASTGKLAGTEYQAIRSQLGKDAKDAFNASRSKEGEALKAVQKALDDAATASISGADKAAWGAANKQYAALKAIEKAAAPTSADAVAGNISPAKLSQALMQGNKNSLLYGAGDQTLPDLARIGQAFIKDQVPNSGTAQRQFYQELLTNPMKIVPGALGGASVPIQALMRSKAGQAYLTQGLLPGMRARLPLEYMAAGATGAGASGLLGYAQ